ncbi:hypothetical protein AV530_011995 [Patagioenas fasciata monilis]|uniref:Uncharacterized protein n=1 Tax=Patagioenas fasciata monilis TaxID=372326 RepID=A0A1V4JVZ0_PATFA|nr:hypothetical protein AV530_011995 [Patagioenas fasciata monilis]
MHTWSQIIRNHMKGVKSPPAPETLSPGIEKAKADVRYKAKYEEISICLVSMKGGRATCDHLRRQQLSGKLPIVLLFHFKPMKEAKASSVMGVESCQLFQNLIFQLQWGKLKLTLLI